jgi:hypothetical protein
MKSGSTSAAETVPFPRRLPATVAALAFASLGGCSVFEPLMPAPPPPPAPVPPPIVSRDGLAPITEDQVERIREQIAAKPPTPAVGRVVRSASPTIESFLRTEGCITARNGAVLNPFAAPGRLFDAQGFQGGPMAQMQYHDKTACVTVKRIQNWKMVSPKLLRFEVVYVGDDGEERAVKHHELMRQPKGGWLFAK